MLQTVAGSGTFRFPVFSLLRVKVPTGNFRYQELSFLGVNVPWNVPQSDNTGERIVLVSTSFVS